MNKEVDIFVPCLVDQFCPQIGWDLIKVVQNLGYATAYNPEQTCCGKLLYDNGNHKGAKEVGEKMIGDFSSANKVVTCSSSCVSYVKNEMAHLFYNTSNHNSYKALADKVMDIVEFIYAINPDCEMGLNINAKIFLQIDCHSLNRYNLEEETRLILSKIKGLTVVNGEGENICCGAGGGLPLYNSVVSEELSKQKVEYAIRQEAEYIVCTDTECMMHLKNYVQIHGLDIKVIHLVNLLAENV